jgi:stearoyl-CoA desaturase (delta-9 desaturase)
MGFGVGFPFLGLIAAIVLMWGRGVGWLDLGLLLGCYTIAALGVTVGFHRMFTHRALRAGPVVRLIFALAGSSSVQGPVLQWCAVHRRHHQHSDRPGDPHSPHLHGPGLSGVLRGMWHAHLGWLFLPEPADLARSVPDLIADPVLAFVDRFFWLWVLIGWVAPGIVAGLILHSWGAALGGLLWGGLVRTFIHHHITWSINSVCHVWGTRPFVVADQSRNNVLFGLLAFGEGWHNNHHAFPTSARHGLRWWQIDGSWWVILALRRLGAVREVRVPAAKAIAARLAQANPDEPVKPAENGSLVSASS